MKFKFEIEQTATGSILESGEVEAKSKGAARDALKEKLDWHCRRSVFPGMIELRIDEVKQ